MTCNTNYFNFRMLFHASIAANKLHPVSVIKIKFQSVFTHH